MTFMSFETKNGEQRGFLPIYILCSIQKKPNSGYGLINEIKEKTEGMWIPSKGTVYPLLKNMEKEGLIVIKTVEKRGKNIYEITWIGKEILKNLFKQKDQMVKKFNQIRRLIVEMIGEEDGKIMNVLFEIGTRSKKLSSNQRTNLIENFEKILSDIKET